MTALEVPRNIWVMFTGFPAASSAIGVAALTPSTLKVVIALPKEISRKQRPARAGLMKFLPRPPKQPLATTIANTAPSTGAYSGTLGLRLRASSRPVTAALQSQTEFGFLQIRLKIHSLATALPTLSSTTSSACHPFTMTPTTVVGSRDSSTIFMIKGVVHRSLRCGEEDRLMAVFISDRLLPVSLPP